MKIRETFKNPRMLKNSPLELFIKFSEKQLYFCRTLAQMSDFL